MKLPELQFREGVGILVTKGSLTTQWQKAVIRHFLEDASSILEQVMAREVDGEIEVLRLFDIL